ncbi:MULTISPECIES: ester cyclase [Mesorhizobium]|uniref:ester cyclase n=1 Tax=Mesorhizobium TaxID=68287 RepID=UPI0010A951A8|nr:MULTISPECIES: ester cyclase [Mesorhizobium]
MNRRDMSATLAAIPLLGMTAMSTAQPTNDDELATIWDKWIAMWNGDLAMADQIIAPDYKLHMSPLGGEDLSIYAGPEGMAGWIGQLHAAIDPFVFEVQVQPLFGDGMIAGRWLASGTYKGGFPGAKAEPGTAIRFAGADFLRVENGKVLEYWLSSDQLDLIKQLGMMA